MIYNVNKLSPREAQVIALYAQGHRALEIADKLYLSIKTIESIRQNVRVKFGIETGVEWMGLLRQFPYSQADGEVANGT